MKAPRAPHTANPRRFNLVLSVLAALFCWGVALVVGGTSGMILALLGLLGLVSGVLSRRKTRDSEPA